MFRGSEVSFRKCNVLASCRPGEVETKVGLLQGSRQEMMRAWIWSLRGSVGKERAGHECYRWRRWRRMTCDLS